MSGLGFGANIEDRKYQAMVSEKKNEEKRDLGSIKDVFTILMVSDSFGFGMARTRIVHLSGTIEEKHRQYKEAFGVEWSGTEPVETPPIPSIRKKKQPVSSGV